MRNLDQISNWVEKIRKNNPFVTVVLVDFNAKSRNWCKANITYFESSRIDTIASSFGLNQLIQVPTQVLTSSSTCIDLIFTWQPNWFMESGIHSSVHLNCHHQRVFANFNFSIFYNSTVLYYEKANTELMRRAID